MTMEPNATTALTAPDLRRVIEQLAWSPVLPPAARWLADALVVHVEDRWKMAAPELFLAGRRAYVAGMDARRAGQVERDNPYPSGDLLGDVWADGFAAAGWYDGEIRERQRAEAAEQRLKAAEEQLAAEREAHRQLREEFHVVGLDRDHARQVELPAAVQRVAELEQAAAHAEEQERALGREVNGALGRAGITLDEHSPEGLAAAVDQLTAQRDEARTQAGAFQRRAEAAEADMAAAEKELARLGEQDVDHAHEVCTRYGVGSGEIGERVDDLAELLAEEQAIVRAAEKVLAEANVARRLGDGPALTLAERIQRLVDERAHDLDLLREDLAHVVDEQLAVAPPVEIRKVPDKPGDWWHRRPHEKGWYIRHVVQGRPGGDSQDHRLYVEEPNPSATAYHDVREYGGEWARPMTPDEVRRIRLVRFPKDPRRRLSTIAHAVTQLEEVIQGKAKEPWRMGDGARGSYVPLLAALGLTLLSRTQIEKRGLALKRGARPLVNAYFGAPIRRRADLWLAELQCRPRDRR